MTLSAPQSFVDVVRERADRLAERRVFTFLAEGEEPADELTYAGLDLRARAVGAELQRRGAAGERVLLLFPPGLDFVVAFLGCLYAGAVAVPAYPPSPGRGTGRLRSLLQDARPRLALTVSAALERVERELAEVAEPPAVQAIDAWPAGLAEDWRPPAVDPSTLAFLQYTSGSTSTPKGVRITHGNLLANERAIQRAFGQSEESVVVGWLPLYHDMGLIGNVLQPIWCGGSCVLMSPLAFLQKPSRWLAAVSRFRATTSGGPDFAYALCVRKVAPAERAGLDLSSWRVAYNGAEPVRAATLDAFAAAFAPSGFRRAAFYPCYGLAEATLFVSGGDPESEPLVQTVQTVQTSRVEEGKPLVGCGRAWPGERVAIVEPETGRLAPAGREGEVWVAGPSVADGYWDRPEETARTFGARLAETGAEAGDGPFLRTGDLGLLDASGELFVTGRLKDLIVVRGRNLYPHDLERTAEESHPALRPGGAAAFSVEMDGEERLVVLVEVERRREAEAVEAAEAVRAALVQEHEIAPWEAVPIRAGSLPKTSSGKVRRSASREEYLAGGLTRVAPTAAPVEVRAGAAAAEGSRLEAVKGLAARLLRVTPESLDPETALPLDSLLALEMKNRLESDFGVQVPLSVLLDGVSVRRLAEAPHPLAPSPIPSPLPGEGEREAGEERVGGEGAPLSRWWGGDGRGDGGEGPPLSHGQLSLWLAHKVAPESPVYNLALAARAEIDPEVLRRALERLAARHAVLRTTYPLVAGEPVQRIGETGGVDFAVLGPAPGRLEEEAWRPFDLEHGPVMRVRLFRAAGETPVLLLALHHIAADFWSLGLLLEELARLVAAEESKADVPPAPAVSYADWTRRQREWLAGPAGERLGAEWQGALAGAPTVLDLPADRPRPPAPTQRSVSSPFSLGAELSERVRALAAASGATLYTVLLAALEALLHRHTGREDLLVGTAAAGRTRPGLEEVVGHFVSLLPVRAELAGDPAFAELLARTRRAVVGALERQDFPFPLLVERLAPARDPARHPLVQTAFVLEQPRRSQGWQGGAAAPFVLGRGGEPLRVGSLVLEPVALPRPATPFDLTLLAVETGGTVEAVLELAADLFDAPTAARLAGRFLTLLAAAAADPSRRLSELPALTDAERSQLLVEWNDTATVPERPERCAHELFEDWADRTPEAPALIGTDGLAETYRELEARANRLANHLRSMGIGPEAPVALRLERSADLWMSALATLKAGGYYVPVDPAWPRERIELVLADCGARAVVTAETLAGLASSSASRPAAGALPGHTAYGLYTSGSTGRPKGVLVPHRPLVNLVQQGARELAIGPGSRLLQVGAPVFDASVLEVFLALTAGAAVCLASEEARLSGPRLAAEMRERGVTWAVLTPAAARFLPADGLPALATLMVGGEALPGSLADRWSGRLRLFNGYGPAEAAVYVARHRCLPGEASPPIGRPIANARLYVLGPWSREPLPPGAGGELHIGGVPPARGYLGRPDLTAERWVPDPFGASGDRLYRTGDRVRWRSDGRLDFLGRIDLQVKLRGVRMEPGEIEAALASHPAVADAAVVTRPGAAGEPVLAAYVVPRDEAGDLAGELRAFLAERLPAALVPTAFVTLPALPVTAVGKVDRAALPPLPMPSSSASGGATGSAAALPRTDMERTIAAVWREVLGVEEVGVDRNFFELGGHSLLLAQVHARLSEVLGTAIPMDEMFSYTTVSALAARLAGEREGGEREGAREIHDRAAARRAAMDRRRARSKL